MIALIIGILVSLVVTIVGTPLLIRLVHKLHYGQYIRQDGPQSHQVKRGTPTLGGVVINLAIVCGWLASAIYRHIVSGEAFSLSAMLVLFAMLSMGVLGFIDDFAKVRKKQNEGLSVAGKFIGQFIFATLYAVLALIIPTRSGFPSAQAGMSFIEEPFFSFEFAGKIVATILFVIWVNFLMTAWTNAVNLTDGLDGLAIGPVMVAAATFGIISYLVGHANFANYLGVHFVPGTGEIAVFIAALIGGGLGFLWYNAPPAAVFMGDTGSLALGGALGAIAVCIKHEIVLAIVGGLFVVEALSVIIQVAYFKRTGRRVFLMAPIHHHFEKKGWAEPQIVIRFWIIAVILALIGLSTLKLR